MSFVSGIGDLLPPGIRGLMLIGMLAALTSTIDTHLNWGASYWSNDIYQRLICRHWLKRDPKSHELVVVAHLSTILIVVIALIVTANLGSIQTAWRISLLFGAGMGSVLVLRWLFERINLYSELAAIITSLVLAPILLFVTKSEWIRLATMAAASTAAAIGITFFTPLTSDRVLKQFYETVHPLGFWPRAASLKGEHTFTPINNLLREMKITLLAALSLFLLLIGVGKFIIPSPDQSLFWPGLYTFLSIALIPFWWQRALKAGSGLES